MFVCGVRRCLIGPKGIPLARNNTLLEGQHRLRDCRIPLQNRRLKERPRAEWAMCILSRCRVPPLLIKVADFDKLPITPRVESLTVAAFSVIVDLIPALEGVVDKPEPLEAGDIPSVWARHISRPQGLVRDSDVSDMEW